MTIIYVLAGVVGAALALTLGYLFGLRRFQGDLSAAVAHASAQARAESDRLAAPETVTHTVVLDGISGSGKTTFALRIAFPCTEPDKLLTLPATARQYLTRPLPLCFDWAGRLAAGGASSPVVNEPPERVHALRFYDVAGERRRTLLNAINDLAGSARTGAVTALWIWDLSNNPGNQRAFSRETVELAYGTDNAKLIKHIVVFLNKVDVMEKTLRPDELARLIDAEKSYIRDIVTSCFDQGMPLTFHQGSTLVGDGMFDAYGALLTALGLGEHFQMIEAGDPPPAAGAAAAS